MTMKFLSDTVVRHLQTVTDLPDLSHTKYRCIQKIASGGMGTVYLTRDTKLHRDTALKVLNIPDPDGVLVDRMLQEARILATLEHPGIVPVHDVGTLPDGRIFYTMKFVKGSRLDHYVLEEHPLPGLLQIFQRVCESVAFAHSREIIHRDLKPENIMVSDFGEVLVMDWGLAKVLRHSVKENAEPETQRYLEETENIRTTSRRDTQEGAVLGTPAYMAPEQASGNTQLLTKRTDVYALGAILHYLLMKEPPQEQSLLRQRNIPKRLKAICMKALSHDPKDRYSNATELASDIERFLNGMSVSSYPESLFERLGRWMDQNRFVMILILTYIVVRFLIYFLARS